VRLVLDTNVLIAAFISRGHCHDLLEHCLREHQPVCSFHILAEYERKLVQKLKYSPAEAKAAVAVIRAGSDLVVPQPLTTPVCRDPDDDWVLATALSGKYRCIVTGDKDLLALGKFAEVAILAPRDFWSFEQQHA
jgi:putative PIN family toxin of toxin-antitoxin system